MIHDARMVSALVTMMNAYIMNACAYVLDPDGNIAMQCRVWLCWLAFLSPDLKSEQASACLCASALLNSYFTVELDKLR